MGRYRFRNYFNSSWSDYAEETDYRMVWDEDIVNSAMRPLAHTHITNEEKEFIWTNTQLFRFLDKIKVIEYEKAYESVYELRIAKRNR
jgi:hypothetical protein